MNRYIEENDVYKLVEPNGTARVHCSQIDDLPRADVVEVRHGRWLPIIERSSYLDAPYYDTGKCSSCGYVVDVSEMHHKYCPFCGAKMDGEE